MTARRNGAGDDALALLIAGDCRAQFLDHANGFVADRQAPRDRIFSLQDVDVGAADRRRGDADKSVGNAHVGNRLLLKDDASRLDEDGGFHLRDIQFL
jgi:hypothetical protein